MPNLSINKTYMDGEILLEADLDNIKTDIETFINTTKVDDSNFQNNSISDTNLIDDTVSSNLFANESVTYNKIANSACTTAKFATDSISTDAIADGAITSSKLAALSVTSAKINQAGTNLTQSQLLARPVWTSSTISSFSTNTGSYVEMASVTVTRTGTVSTRPFICLLQPANGTDTGYLRCYGGPYNTAQIDYGMWLYFAKDNINIWDNPQKFGVNTTSNYTNIYFDDRIPPSAFFGVFSSNASSFTIKAMVKSTDTSTTVSANALKLVVVEL